MKSSITHSRALIAAAILATATVQAAPAAATAFDGPRVDVIHVSADATAGEARTRTYSRADLRSFVIAAMQIDRVIRRRSEARPSERPGSQASSVRTRIRAIIEATPRLDPARYRAIAETVRTDPVLRSRVRQVIQDLRNEKHDALNAQTVDTF